jgi:glycosyltransferase involved in cell wall biosynthesis
VPARHTHELSVIICSHNPRPSYLRRVLDALRKQSLAKDRWELLLIDNASGKPLRSEWDLSWHPNGRHALETELGIAPARRRGLCESSSDLALFVDDDNVLAPDYLSKALEIGHQWPCLGTWGSGAIIPEFEIEPPEPAKDFLPLLALREASAPRWGNVIGEATPWGAGMCLRKEVAVAYIRHCEQTSMPISSRQGKSFLGGEDVEMSEVACEMGFGTGVFPQLKLTHLIPKERTSIRYLLKVYEGSETSRYVLTYKWKGSLPPYPLSFRGLLSIGKNLMVTRGLQRRTYLAKVRAMIRARRIIKSYAQR